MRHSVLEWATAVLSLEQPSSSPVTDSPTEPGPEQADPGSGVSPRVLARRVTEADYSRGR